MEVEAGYEDDAVQGGNYLTKCKYTIIQAIKQEYAFKYLSRDESARLGGAQPGGEDESQLSVEDALAILQKFTSILYGRVWFTIVEGLAQYNIVIYYDNAKNQPNGEDL